MRTILITVLLIMAILFIYVHIFEGESGLKEGYKEQGRFFHDMTESMNP